MRCLLCSQPWFSAWMWASPCPTQPRVKSLHLHRRKKSSRSLSSARYSSTVIEQGIILKNRPLIFIQCLSVRFLQRPRMNWLWFCLARIPPKTLWTRMGNTRTSQCIVILWCRTLSCWRRLNIRSTLRINRLTVSFVGLIYKFCTAYC